MILSFRCALPRVKFFYLHSYPRSAQPSISLAYSVLILLVTTSLFSLLHFRYYHYHYHTKVAINILLQEKYISSAVELTTQLSKLISILWLPLCRINKLG